MVKFFYLTLFFWITFPVTLYSKEAYLKKPEVILTENELIVVSQLVGGIDLDRMAIIEKGINVNLVIQVTIYKKNYIFDEVVKYIINTNKILTTLEIKKELSYNYITKNYIIKYFKNYAGDKNVENYFSGNDLRESYKILKTQFFEKKVIFYIDLANIDLKDGMSYYVEVESQFYAVTTIPNFPIAIPNTYNFKTKKVKSHEFTK